MLGFIAYNLARSRPRPAIRLAALAAGVGLFIAAVPVPPAARSSAGVTERAAPSTLAETGLYADPSALMVDPSHIAFEPQYPLWTDGAAKRRWISLPPGAAIDASNPEAWDFPVGTRFWKEFAFAGRRVETRYMERLSDGSWMFASYGWDEDGRSAALVSEKGRMGAHPLENGRSHAIPSVTDCRICHLSGSVPVLGFTALQLANDAAGPSLHDSVADPNPQLRSLAGRGALAGFDPQLLRASAPAATALDLAARGYLHGNCSHCHNSVGPLAGLGLDLRQSALDPNAGALATAVGRPLRSPLAGLAPGTLYRIAPGYPRHSAVPQRMASRLPALQMPPFGTALVDPDGVALITRWIAEMESVPIEARHNTGREQ